MARKRLDRRTVLMIGLGVVVAAVVAAFVVVLVVNRQGEAEPAATTTTTLPVPTPEAEPVARETSTALLAALPDTVLGYAVGAQEADTALVDAGALEAWRLTYSSAEGDVVLLVGQWETAEEAAEAASAQLADGTVVDEGAVQVASEDAGAFRVVETADGGGAVWTNGTAVFVAQGADAESLGAFYRAYPL